MENYAGHSARTSRVANEGRTTAHHWIALLLLSCATLLSPSAHALSAANISIRSPVNIATTVDLTTSIDNPTSAALILSVSSAPQHGTAMVVDSSGTTVI